MLVATYNPNCNYFLTTSPYANENPWINKYPYVSQLLCVIRGFDYGDHIYDP